MGKETWQEPKIIIWKCPDRHQHHGSLKYCRTELLFSSSDQLDNCCILSRITGHESNQIWNEEDQRISEQILQHCVTEHLASKLWLFSSLIVKFSTYSWSRVREWYDTTYDNDKVKVLKYHLTKLISGCKSFQTLKVKGEDRSYITRNDKIRKYKSDNAIRYI